jgi:hypothetical protein
MNRLCSGLNFLLFRNRVEHSHMHKCIHCSKNKRSLVRAKVEFMVIFPCRSK